MVKGKINDPIAQKAFDLWTALNSGDKWLAFAPGTPEGILTAYRDAIGKLAAEPEFLQQGEKISEGLPRCPPAMSKPWSRPWWTRRARRWTTPRP
jgi:hypothetical protein